jgi:carboxypeptidase C (cathepsin A)
MADEAAKPQDEKKAVELTEETPVVRQHDAGGIKYRTVTGRMPIFDEDGKIEQQIFFMAYLKEDEEAGTRPLMFSFNGGPGSPSIWLHLGALGPKRAPMEDDGNLPKPPYKVIDNPHHWLGETDLVFIDPIGTGYSRAKDEKTAEKCWGLQGDIESVGEFIRMFLTRHKRWGSPLYLVGESYGTTRAAGLAGWLIDRGVAFNGIVLVSSILNFQTAEFRKGNDLPYPLFLPTYTATAHYHGKVKGSLATALKESKAFALGDYWTALGQGDRLPAKQRKAVGAKLARLTGLSESFVDGCDLRIHIQDFCKELMRDKKRTVGRLDSRIRGIDDFSKNSDQRPEHDPSMSILMAPYTAAFNQYVREELGYETDLVYEVFRGVKKPWQYGPAREGYPDTSEALRKAMARNPYMKVYVASGLFDLATPFFATEYTLSHMGLDPSLRGNFTTDEYEAGHMMYIETGCLARLKANVAAFVKSAL